MNPAISRYFLLMSGSGFLADKFAGLGIKEPGFFQAGLQANIGGRGIKVRGQRRHLLENGAGDVLECLALLGGRGLVASFEGQEHSPGLSVKIARWLGWQLRHVPHALDGFPVPGKSDSELGRFRLIGKLLGFQGQLRSVTLTEQGTVIAGDAGHRFLGPELLALRAENGVDQIAQFGPDCSPTGPDS